MDYLFSLFCCFTIYNCDICISHPLKVYATCQIRCTKCQGKSERQEKMMDLTVEIEGDIRTLEEALRRFTVSETLDGENKYRCDR